MGRLVVSENVSYGHPDKMADIIADAIVGNYIEGDKNSRCGIEVMIKDNTVIVGGEVKSNATINIDKIVKDIFNDIKFPNNHNLSPNDIKIINLIGKQSIEISKGVDKSEEEIGSGDQGVVFGFASNETEELMPLGNQFARDLWKEIIKVEGLGPDIKTQITVDEDTKKIREIVVSTMHQISLDETRNIIMDIIDKLLGTKYKKNQDEFMVYTINPNGEWRIGGSVSDAGITGRKLVVDSYGSACQIGGGNYSGKDMSKVDRSGAYMARYIAKNIVASGLADEAKVQLGYIISKPTPSTVTIELKNGKASSVEIEEWVRNNIDLSVVNMIRNFNCKEVYLNTSKYGHFGDNEYPWEKLDIVENIREDFGLS